MHAIKSTAGIAEYRIVSRTHAKVVDIVPGVPDQYIVARAAVQGIVAETAVQIVTAGAALEPVVVLIASNSIVKRIAARYARFGKRIKKNQGLNIVRQRVIHTAEDGVGVALVRIFNYHIGSPHAR